MLATAAAEEQKLQALEGEGGAQAQGEGEVVTIDVVAGVAEGVVEGGVADEGGSLGVEGDVKGAGVAALLETTAVTMATSMRTMAADDDEGSVPGEGGGGMGVLLASLVEESLGNNKDKGTVPDPDAIPDHSHHSDVSSTCNLSPRWTPRNDVSVSVSPGLEMIQETAADEGDDRRRDPSAYALTRSVSHLSQLSASPSNIAPLDNTSYNNSSNSSSNKNPLSSVSPSVADFAPLTMVSQFQLVLSPGEERVVLAWVQIARAPEPAERTNAAATATAAAVRNMIAEVLDGIEGIDDAAAALAAPQMFLVAGKVRVFEQRNQDLVRAVPFSCQVMFPFQGQEPLTRVSPSSRGGREDGADQGGERGQASGDNDRTTLEGVVSGSHLTADVARNDKDKDNKAWAGSRFMEMPSTTVRRESFPAVPLPPLAMSRIADPAAAAGAADDIEGQGANGRGSTPLSNTDATNTPVPSPRSLSRRPSSVMAAFAAGGGSVALEAISEESQYPLHASAASNLALNKLTHVPSSQLVTFPDLELDEVTGKW